MTTARKYKYWAVMWVKEAADTCHPDSESDMCDNGLYERKSEGMKALNWWRCEDNNVDPIQNPEQYQLVEVWLTREEASAINNWLEYRSEF